MINQLFKNYMGLRPDDIFINYHNKDITYSSMTYALESRIKSMQAININKDSIIGIYMDNNLDLLEILFACIEIQAIPLIIPSTFKSKEIDDVCHHVPFDYFITNWNNSENLPKRDIPIFPIEELSPGIGGCAPSQSTNFNSKQTACLLLTSGTMGTPKIAQISIGNIIANCNAWNKIMHFNQNDVYFNCLPLHHIGGLSIIFRALLFGFKVILSDKFDKNFSIQEMIQYQANIVSLVPTMLSRIVRSKPNKNLAKMLRAVILGGSDCRENLIKNAIKENFNIYKTYGMTESSSGIFGFWVKDNMNHMNSAGLPHDQVEFKISEDKILLKGPSIIKQYYDSPIIEDWHNTNDRGYISKEGFLYVLGREDYAISGGENINLKEIESIIKKHPKVERALVKNIPDDEWGDYLIAYLYADDLDLLEIKEWLINQVSNYKIPKEFILMDKID